LRTARGIRQTQAYGNCTERLGPPYHGRLRMQRKKCNRFNGTRTFAGVRRWLVFSLSRRKQGFESPRERHARLFGGRNRAAILGTFLDDWRLAILQSDGFRSDRDAHGVESARLTPCLTAFNCDGLKTNEALLLLGSSAAAALPTTAGSRDSRHGICRITQKFGQGEPPFEFEPLGYSDYLTAIVDLFDQRRSP
jgi:hypothetical protein